jgi:hypothetical protein
VLPEGQWPSAVMFSKNHFGVQRLLAYNVLQTVGGGCLRCIIRQLLFVSAAFVSAASSAAPGSHASSQGPPPGLCSVIHCTTAALGAIH